MGEYELEDDDGENGHLDEDALLEEELALGLGVPMPDSRGQYYTGAWADDLEDTTDDERGGAEGEEDELYTEEDFDDVAAQSGNPNMNGARSSSARGTHNQIAFSDDEDLWDATTGTESGQLAAQTGSVSPPDSWIFVDSRGELVHRNLTEGLSSSSSSSSAQSSAANGYYDAQQLPAEGYYDREPELEQDPPSSEELVSNEGNIYLNSLQSTSNGQHASPPSSPFRSSYSFPSSEEADDEFDDLPLDPMDADSSTTATKEYHAVGYSYSGTMKGELKGSVENGSVDTLVIENNHGKGRERDEEDQDEA